MKESFHVDISNYEPSIDTYIANLMLDSHSPSLVAAIIRDNNIIWAKGYGEQPELDRIYMIASITKVFTAVALLQLYEQGLFLLDDDVSEYLPFSLRNPIYPETSITFRMLLSHTSSISGYSEALEFHMYTDALEKLGLDGYIPNWLPYPEWFSEYFLENGSLYELSNWATYKPGAHYIYSNVGFTLLAYLIEIISEKRIDEYVRENIYTPL
jgi:CubicO group peptidase (beta-lactamase class C family)